MENDKYLMIFRGSMLPPFSVYQSKKNMAEARICDAAAVVLPFNVRY